MKRLLVPTDFSEVSRVAVGHSEKVIQKSPVPVMTLWVPCGGTADRRALEAARNPQGARSGSIGAGWDGIP